jgi:hypothetical protein
MACNLMTAGIPKDCDNNLGGVRRIYITDFENVTSITAATGTISAFTMASGTVFYEFEFNKNTSSFAENATISIENGSLFYEQLVTLIIPRREVAKRNVLATLMQKDLAVIVLDQNGLYWYIGEANGANVSELPSTTGTAKGDANAYTITIRGEEPNQAQEASSAAVAAVI